MDAFIAKIAEPEVLWALGIAFFLGFMVRGGGGSRTPPPAPLTPEEIAAAVKRVPSTTWMEIDAELAARRKISAIKLLRLATGLGLKDAKGVIDARAAKNEIVL